MHFTKFGRNWLNFKDKNIVNFINVFFLHSLEKGGILRLNKLESPLSKDGLFQIWLKLAQWSWRRSYKIRCSIFAIRNYLPFLKRTGHFVRTTWITSTEECFLPSSVEIWPVALEKKKKWNDYRQTDGRTTDNRQSEKLTWAFSSGELKAWEE